MLDPNQPVKGKTYSLFGIFVSTNFFYDQVDNLIHQITQAEELSEEGLLTYIQRISMNRRNLRRNASLTGSDSRLSRILSLLHNTFQEYTEGIEEHLKSTPLYKMCTDRELLTSREQYYIYLIEFELINRIHIQRFLNADYKIALLPYCLRTTQTECKAAIEQVDYQCTGCHNNCYVNHISTLLKQHEVEPYIWRNAKLKPLFKNLSSQYGRLGVLGIACVVELISGMRRCMKARIPVVGIPLNANRCIRWTNRMNQTSLDLNALERLLKRN